MFPWLSVFFNVIFGLFYSIVFTLFVFKESFNFNFYYSLEWIDFVLSIFVFDFAYGDKKVSWVLTLLNLWAYLKSLIAEFFLFEALLDVGLLKFFTFK